MYPRHNNRPAFAGKHFGKATHQSGGRFQHRRPQSGGFRGNSRGKAVGQFNDVSKFVNRAVITEQAEHFSPEHEFADFKIETRLKQNITGKGYKIPTPIQDRAIPIDEELKAFTRGMRIFSAVCVGGASMGAQIRALRYQNNFVIGTPGRLKDLIEQKYLRLSEFRTVVLDEADRMLDMGFINDMKFMMARMPKERHTLFFSATMSREIENLVKAFLKEPVT